MVGEGGEGGSEARCGGGGRRGAAAEGGEEGRRGLLRGSKAGCGGRGRRGAAAEGGEEGRCGLLHGRRNEKEEKRGGAAGCWGIRVLCCEEVGLELLGLFSLGFGATVQSGYYPILMDRISA